MVWLKGLLSVFISGCATAVAVMIADPTTFNLEEGAKKTATVALVSGIVAVANYLKQSPLP